MQTRLETKRKFPMISYSLSPDLELCSCLNVNIFVGSSDILHPIFPCCTLLMMENRNCNVLFKIQELHFFFFHNGIRLRDSWTHGVKFIGLLNTGKARSSYFSMLSGWEKSKFTKDNLKQSRKKAKKTILKCCDKTEETWREKCGTLWPDLGIRWLRPAGSGGDDRRHTCSPLEEKASEQVRRMSAVKWGWKQQSKMKQETQERNMA